MKRLSRLYRWILVSVLLQVIGLAYLNFIYLPNRGNIKASMYEISEDGIESKSMGLPAPVKDVKVSFNGLFAAYMNGGSLAIADVKSGKTVKSLDLQKGEFGYYRWLPDRDMLIYSEKSPDGRKGQVRISTYDIGSGLDRSYPRITGLPDNSEVTDIELSPLTNVVYAMIKTGTSRVKIYKYDIMDNLKFVMNAGIDTDMEESAYNDFLVYQSSGGKIYLRNGKTGGTKSVSPSAGSVLLGVDSDDNIYAGAAGKDGKIKEIYFGRPDMQVKSWKKTVLPAPAVSADITVTPGGTVFVAERDLQKICSADGDAVIKYKGILLDILDDYIVSQDGNRLHLTAIGS